MVARGLMLMLVTSSGCGQGPPPPEFDGDAALEYVRTQLSFGPRIAGSEGHRAMGDWLDSMLTVRADSLVVQAWDHTAADGTVLPMRNFIARFNRSAETRVLLVAHWDTRPVADAADSRDPSAPVPGANDGGSGVAVLLGIADQFRVSAPAIGVDLLFVDGEDYGSFYADGQPDVLIGSKYYASHQLEGAKPRMAVVLDMVGDADLQIYQEGYSLTGAPEVVDRFWGVAADLGYGHIFIGQPRHSLTDDHVPLQQAGISAIDVIDFDYAAWHTPDDTIDKVSARSLEIVGQVVLGFINSIP